MKLIAMVLGCCAMMVCSVAVAGSITGAGKAEDALDPGGSKKYSDFFEGGKLALISVSSSDPNGDIDCHLLDKDNTVLASEYGLENTCDFAWVPDSSAKYAVRITNSGERAVVVTIRTN